MLCTFPNFDFYIFLISDPNFCTTINGVNVCIVKGDITKQTVNVVVNSISKDLVLSRGHVSKAILQAAGEHIQVECESDGMLKP